MDARRQMTDDEKNLLRAAFAEVSKAGAILEFMRSNLSDKYGLTAADLILPDGTIVYSAPNTAEA